MIYKTVPSFFLFKHCEKLATGTALSLRFQKLYGECILINSNRL